MELENLKNNIEKIWKNPEILKDASNSEYVKQAVTLIDQGKLRVAEKVADKWQVNLWAKYAVLLFFKIAKMELVECSPFTFADKIKIKGKNSIKGVRVVPGAIARFGSFIEEGAILMPSFVNIGAYVGSGSMIDTWATVGSCAQIGRNVHLSGGVGIGGVLEPPQGMPVIIEDNVFVGSRAIVVEGIHVEEGAVLGANVVITKSTKIIDVTGTEPKFLEAKIPSNSVVIPGTRKKEFPSGEFEVPCALVIGKRKESTDKKTSLNQVLRDFSLSV